MNTLKLIASSSFLTVNKEIIKKIGLNEAVVLAELCSAYCYFSDKHQLNEEGMFFKDVKDMEEATTLTDHLQRKALDNLRESGIIYQKNMGLPQHRYFKINQEKLTEILESGPNS